MSGTIVNNFKIIALMMQSISVLMGVAFTLGGIIKLKRVGEARFGGGHEGAMIPVLMLVCGAIFFILPSFIGTFGIAIFGSANDLRYDPSGGISSADIKDAVVVFVRLIGIGSFMRGVVLLSRSGGHQSQPGSLSKAIVHMVSGLLCVHIVGTVYIIGEILGLN